MLGQPDCARVRVVIRVVIAAAALATIGTAAQAQGLPDGEYSGTGDGTQVSLTVRGETAEVRSTVRGQCSGHGTGRLSTVAEGQWRVTMTESGLCTVNIRSTSNGFEMEPDYATDCQNYSGQSCGFYGVVTAN